MIKVITKKMVKLDGHHAYIYFNDGTKKEIEMKTVFAFLDENGNLHASKWEDLASNFGDGKYLFIEEANIKCEGGYLVINGHSVKIYGAGKGWVYPTAESKAKDHKYITQKGTVEVKDSISILHTDKIKKEDAIIANKLYLLLK